MIFADKLINLRKKNGWSQEELAELMNVSRQAISKWEGAQSIPSLDKILTLSKLFGVSTDFLLKDEIDKSEDTDILMDIEKNMYVSIEEALCFLTVKEETSKKIAFATFLCILSPICLLFLGALSEEKRYNISVDMAFGVGMIVMIILALFAIVLFVISGNKTAQYEYLEKESFETGYGLEEIVKEKQKKYLPTYNKLNILAIILCVISTIPLFMGIMINENNVILIISMLNVLLLISGMGVYIFIRTGIVWSSYEKLLQVGDYTNEKKRLAPTIELFGWIYWLIVVAVFLGYSFKTSNWEFSWGILVIGGILFPALLATIKLFQKKNKF